MTPQEAKLARERMATQPFVPLEGPIEGHSIHALNYIAFSLGEIEKHLAVLARSVQSEGAIANVGAGLYSIREAIKNR
jgi:hypothetical protein